MIKGKGGKCLPLLMLISNMAYGVGPQKLIVNRIWIPISAVQKIEWTDTHLYLKNKIIYEF